MSRHDPLVTLKQMRDAAETAMKMVEGRTREDLDNERILEPALRYQMVVIGEAANRLPQDVLERSPRTPWREIIGMRNVTVHEYDVVDADVLWHAATVDVPELLADLAALIALLEQDRPES